MTNILMLYDFRLMSIAAFERECGLPKDTLRVWERRYGFRTEMAISDSKLEKIRGDALRIADVGGHWSGRSPDRACAAASRTNL